MSAMFLHVLINTIIMILHNETATVSASNFRASARLSAASASASRAAAPRARAASATARAGFYSAAPKNIHCID